MTKIGLLGDTHGATPWVINMVLPKMADEGITSIIQVGDFGVWPGDSGARFAKAVCLKLGQYGQIMYVAPGNHEDYGQINAIPVEDDGWQHFRPNILLAPRGLRTEFGDKSFVFLGGAPSVDRAYRTHYGARKSWWAQEMITQADVDRTVAGGYADVMICHDAPFGVSYIDRAISGNPFGFVEEDLKYADEGRKIMTEAFLGVKPHTFVHGHYHVPGSEYLGETHMVGLDCEHRNGSVGFLDTDTMDVTVWAYQELTERK